MVSEMISSACYILLNKLNIPAQGFIKIAEVHPHKDEPSSAFSTVLSRRVALGHDNC